MKQAKKQQVQQEVQPIQDADTEVTMAEAYDDEPAFNQIDKLELCGINGGDIMKLKAAGLCTVLAVLMW